MLVLIVVLTIAPGLHNHKGNDHHRNRNLWNNKAGKQYNCSQSVASLDKMECLALRLCY